MNTNEKTYTIYIHETPVGKRYVGMTSFNPPYQRFQRGYRDNHDFWADITKYGWDNIKTTYVAKTVGLVNARVIENAFMEAYNTLNPKYGYNVVSNRKGCLNQRTSARKKKVYGTRKEAKGTGRNYDHVEVQTSRKEVCQYDTDGNFIAKYRSIKEASRALGKERVHGQISRACQGRVRVSHGYIWKYATDVETG